MKPKFTVITIACLFLSMALIIRCKSSSKNNEENIRQFMNKFSLALASKQPDSALNFFDKTNNIFRIKRLINLLEGNDGYYTHSGPIFKLNLDFPGSAITFPSPDIADVTVPVNFLHDTIASENSSLTFKLLIGEHKDVKIMLVDYNKFIHDYISSESLVKSKTLTDKDIFSPITLQAFKTADQLKSKYDSVIWFAHINQKTFYYVVKGKWDYDGDLDRQQDTAINYKMGLVGPDLKEIIPVEYDLIHNIGGTFDGLVEVEKNNKRGFYDLDGKIVVPVIYDQVFPITSSENLAALRLGNDYYWLKNDLSITGKVDIKIGDIVSNLKQAASFSVTGQQLNNITEFNSRERNGTVYIPPSYLVDLNILPMIKTFKNPLRRNIEYDDVSTSYQVKFDKQNNYSGNWLTSAFYSIRDYFLGGRSEFYDTKNMVVTDAKHNKVYSFGFSTDYSSEEDGGGDLSGSCNEFILKPLNDSLFELKATAVTEISLHNQDILAEMPVYHYLQLKNGKLVEMKTDRLFGFTKFIKMDDSYLDGCYLYRAKIPGSDTGFKKSNIDHLPEEAIKYMKNEIFADYHYKFRDSTWSQIFEEGFPNYKNENSSVDDSLTEIDKYNINWITQKLKASNIKKLASN
jgi:hypothetical protein